MSKARRADRRGRRGGARSRRMPARAARGRGLQLPWIPVAVVAGIAAVVGIIVYLVIQTGQPASKRFAEAERIEADASPDLPGKWINLPEIYGGPYPDTGNHVKRQVDYVADGNSNPPVGGPHWGSGECPEDPEDAPPFCGPVPRGIYDKPWEPEPLVHNLEHGFTVIWYNTSDEDLRLELEELIEDRLNDGEFLVMAPYPDMEEEHIALTSWSRIDKFPVSDYSKDRVETFLNAYECRFNPEGICK